MFDIQEDKMIECMNSYSCRMYQSYEEVLEDQEKNPRLEMDDYE